MHFVTCTHDAHAPEILAILNDAILHSTALYEYAPRTQESMKEWFQTREEGHFPILGAIGESGQLLGFAGYNTFRTKPACRYSVEHSVYVHRDHRGRGIGHALMLHLIGTARAQQVHTMIGALDMANSTSIALHERLGFTHAGTIREAAYKFGRWLDLGFYQLLLETPAHPTEENPSPSDRNNGDTRP